MAKKPTVDLLVVIDRKKVNGEERFDVEVFNRRTNKSKGHSRNLSRDGMERYNRQVADRTKRAGGAVEFTTRENFKAQGSHAGRRKPTL